MKMSILIASLQSCLSFAIWPWTSKMDRSQINFAEFLLLNTLKQKKTVFH